MVDIRGPIKNRPISTIVRHMEQLSHIDHPPGSTAYAQLGQVVKDMCPT